LLRFAKVKETLESQGALDDALTMAWVSDQEEIDSRDYPPAKLLKNLDKAICQTKELLREAEKHLRCSKIAFDLCPIGEGTISVKPMREMILENQSVSHDSRPPSLPYSIAGPFAATIAATPMIGVKTFLGDGIRKAVHAGRLW
jgi:hypothetical protein